MIPYGVVLSGLYNPPNKAYNPPNKAFEHCPSDFERISYAPTTKKKLNYPTPGSRDE